MRILIASDLHGALDSAEFLVEKALSLKPDVCVLLGDYLYHGPRNPLPLSYTPKDVATTLGAIGDAGINILAVRGNCDAAVDEGLLPFALTEQAQLHVDGLTLLAAHGHQYGRNPNFSGIAAGTVMLTGHIHFPVGTTKDHVTWWNPGTLSLPKHGFPRTYAFYENGTFTVYDMQGDVVLSHEAGTSRAQHMHPDYEAKIGETLAALGI